MPKKLGVSSLTAKYSYLFLCVGKMHEKYITVIGSRTGTHSLIKNACANHCTKWAANFGRGNLKICQSRIRHKAYSLILYFFLGIFRRIQ